MESMIGSMPSPCAPKMLAMPASPAHSSSMAADIWAMPAPSPPQPSGMAAVSQPSRAPARTRSQAK
jgi:hypothetical protein